MIIRTRTEFVSLIIAVLLLAFSTVTSEAVENDREGSAPIVNIGSDGFHFTSADGEFSLSLGGYLQTDSRFFLDDDQDLTDTFLVRRARINVEATFYKYITVRFLPDFGGGTTVIQDAYIEWHQFGAAKVRAGKFKSPISLERLQSATNILFVERALPSNLVPNRDIGIQLSGDFANDNILYHAAVVNGAQDNASIDTDTDDGMDIVGRLFVNPSSKSSFLGGLGFGIGASAGKAGTNLPAYRTPGQATFFRYNDTVTAEENQQRLSPQAQFYRGPLLIHAEYVLSSIELRQAEVVEKVKNQSWQIAGGYILTGEPATTETLTPFSPFDPTKGKWGAWQIAARYSELSIDDDAFISGFADPLRSADEAKAWAIGLNWYWNSNARIVFNFERTKFEGGAEDGDRDDENTFFTRFQIAF